MYGGNCMKFKRIIAFVLALVMVMATVACSNSTNSDNSKGGNDNTAKKAGQTAIKKEDLKVGVIHIGDPASGSGYSYTHDVGIQAMQKELGLQDSQIIRKNNISDSDNAAIKQAIEECVAEKCQIIFGTSWGYMDPMEEMAKKYPEVVFSHGSGYKSNDSNFNNYFGRIYQARYLTGIVAGMNTKSNKIGYVAAMGDSNSEVTGGINAFALGVKAVNPSAQVFVKVTNTWFDVTLEGQAAEALLDEGCDVIAQHQDTTAPQLAAEKRGAFSIGYNSDMSKDAPKANLTSAIWNWGVYYTLATKQVLEGKWTNENYFGGMDDGLVDISPLTSLCSKDTQAKVDEVKAKIKDGSFKVFEGEIKDNKGNVVNKAGSVISDADITGKMTWYNENVTVK